MTKRRILVVTIVALPLAVVGWLLLGHRVPREVPTTGIVVFESGAPCEHARVTWRHANGAAAGSAGRGRGGGGRFWAGTTPEGTVFLRAQIPGGVSSPEVAVQAGERNVRIVVPDGAALALRFEPWSAEVGEYAEVRASDARGGDLRASVLVPVTDDGRSRLPGLRPGAAYDVFFQSLGTCRGAWARGLVPGPDERVVRLVEAKPIRGRLVLPSGRVDPAVSLEGGLGEGGAISNGRFTIPCVPPGTWRIVAWTYADHETYWEGTAEVRAGAEDVEIHLVRAKEP
jgi:hypothetical protein